MRFRSFQQVENAVEVFPYYDEAVAYRLDFMESRWLLRRSWGDHCNEKDFKAMYQYIVGEITFDDIVDALNKPDVPTVTFREALEHLGIELD